MKRLRNIGTGLIELEFATLWRMHLEWNEYVEYEDQVMARILTLFASDKGSEHEIDLHLECVAGYDNITLFLRWKSVLCDRVVQKSAS